MVRPTLKSIAEYAGVSRGTVDRVLHGRPKVNPEKRKRVEEALRKFNYTPNAAARSLALKTQNFKIGVIHPRWPAYFEDEISRGVSSAKSNLNDYSLDVLIRRFVEDSPDDCIRAIDSLLAEGARALAICSKNTAPVRKRLLALTREKFPVITFNSDVPKSGRLCFVGQDDEKAGRIAGDLMMKLVPKDGPLLAVGNYLEYESTQNRLSGFRAKLAELGYAGGQFPILESHNLYDVTYKKVLDHLRKQTDIVGLYMATQSTAAAIAAVEDAGLTGRVRIVCHDLPSSTRQSLRMGLLDFAVDQNIYHQGFSPVTLLSDVLMAGKFPEEERLYAPITIACSESV